MSAEPVQFKDDEVVLMSESYVGHGPDHPRTHVSDRVHLSLTVNPLRQVVTLGVTAKYAGTEG